MSTPRSTPTNSTPKIRFTTLIAALASVVLGLATSPSASAAVSGPANCDLRFEVKGTDIQILIGKSKLKGSGEIFCQDAQGNQELLNVKVNVGTPVLFPRIAFAPSVVVRGESKNIGVQSGGAKSLLGQYLTVDVRGSLSSGAGANLALLSEDSGLALNLTVVGVEGFGIAVGGTIVSIEL